MHSLLESRGEYYLSVYIIQIFSETMESRCRSWERWDRIFQPSTISNIWTEWKDTYRESVKNQNLELTTGKKIIAFSIINLSLCYHPQIKSPRCIIGKGKQRSTQIKNNSMDGARWKLLFVLIYYFVIFYFMCQCLFIINIFIHIITF